MEFLRSNLSEFRLSPVERKLKQDLLNAVHVLDATVKEFHGRTDGGDPNLKARELIQNSSKAINTLKVFIERRFDGT